MALKIGTRARATGRNLLIYDSTPARLVTGRWRGARIARPAHWRRTRRMETTPKPPAEALPSYTHDLSVYKTLSAACAAGIELPCACRGCPERGAPTHILST